ncbi:B-cell receptor CD22-like isoform X2 [Haliotis rubra]|uniref:B-cell receptor CD22-like isoform X2 n=1 Tax=Haliotis rubra TaxID=36100 RepID=UPI001EE61251|nr:B-cell receptor CD22-like isoform X2 [Haliotis rubra]
MKAVPIKCGLDDVQCTQLDTDLKDCKHSPWGTNDCSDPEAVGVECFSFPIAVHLEPPGSVLNVILGQLISVVCVVDDFNYPATSYRWTHSGRSYSGQVFSTTITSKNDSGILTCTIENVLVSTRINVWYPPEVHLEPSNDTINVGVGEDLRVQCVVDDANPSVHTFRWSHDGRTNTGSTFIKRNVTKSDQGQLTCTADNGHMMTPGRAVVTVNVIYPPKIHLEPNRLVINVKQGGDVTVVCVVDDANPSVTSFTWLHNNSISHGEVFTKGDVSTSDAGNLSCSATNGQGTSLVMTKIIVNTYMPLVHLEPRNNTLDVVVGEDLLVQCTVDDVSPTAYTFRWSHNGQTCTGSTFLIQNVTKSDRGQLSCTVDNRHTMAPVRTDATINVKYPPEIHLSTREGVISVTAGNAVEVECVVDDANPAVTSYMWRHNGDISYGQTFLKHVSSSDSGNLSCSATNEQGTSTVQTSIEVLQASSLIGNDGTTSKNKVIAIATGSVGIGIIVILLLIVIYQRRRRHAAKPENIPAENQQRTAQASKAVDGGSQQHYESTERPSGGAENSYCEIEMTPRKDAEPAHIYGNLGFKDEENTRQEPGTASGPTYGNIQIGMSEKIPPKREVKERKGRKPRGHKEEHVYENTVVRN